MFSEAPSLEALLHLKEALEGVGATGSRDATGSGDATGSRPAPEASARLVGVTGSIGIRIDVPIHLFKDAFSEVHVVLDAVSLSQGTMGQPGTQHTMADIAQEWADH